VVLLHKERTSVPHTPFVPLPPLPEMMTDHELRREEEGLQLRKQKREEQLYKKRNALVTGHENDATEVLGIDVSLKL